MEAESSKDEVHFMDEIVPESPTEDDFLPQRSQVKIRLSKRKISFADIIGKLQDINVTCSLTEAAYAMTNTKVKADFCCAVHGETWTSPLCCVLRKSKMCTQCRKLENQQKVALDTKFESKGVKRLKIMSNKSEFQCLVNLEHVWTETTQQVYIRKYACFFCQGKTSNNKIFKIDKQDFVKHIVSLGYTLVNATEINTTQDFGEFRCTQGHTWRTVISNVFKEKSGCPECSKPSCEAITIYIMEKLLNKRFTKTRRVLPSGLELDGYNDELKLAVEYNGSQHYVENKLHFHRDEGSFEEQQQRDKRKRKECEQMSITLITLHYSLNTFDRIRAFLESKLNTGKYETVTNLNWDELKNDFRSNYDVNLKNLNQIRDIVESKDGECLSVNYIGGNDRMLFKCAVVDHPEFESTATHIRSGRWCARCASNAKLDDDIPSMNPPENTDNIPKLKDRMRMIRERIDKYLETGKIVENMLPIVDGVLCPTKTMLDLLDTLDPRGIGRIGARAIMNSDIHERMPCCRLLSFFGHVDDLQIFICLKTLLIFSRSRDNIRQSDRMNCPLCVFARDEDSSRRKFGHEDFWAAIPIYTYTFARKTKRNSEPLKFIAKYLTVDDAVKDEQGNYPKNIMVVMKPLRFSLFQCSNSFFAKTTIPKRATCRSQYVSYYPPHDGLMSEENPSWILSRRLNCAVILFMRDYYQAQYVKEREADNESYKRKKMDD